MSKLKDRVLSYHNVSDYKLLNKVPIVICVNGQNFVKNTELLDKPHCDKFSECILSTMMRLCNDISGVFFGYQHNDEIVLLLRNDQNPDTEPMFDNRIQKICSIVSSIATSHFNNCAKLVNLNLISDAVFYAEVFAVPTIMEAMNTMIYKQQQNFYQSIQLACFYELLKLYDKHTIKDMLSGLSVDEKIDLLNQECNINFNSYPLTFRRGAACYKTPKIDNDIFKNKWNIDLELPIFTKDTSFLSNIFRMGSDIYRG